MGRCGAFAVGILSTAQTPRPFVHAAANAIGIHELPAHKTRRDIAQMDLIMIWLDEWRVHDWMPKYHPILRT